MDPDNHSQVEVEFLYPPPGPPAWPSRKRLIRGLITSRALIDRNQGPDRNIVHEHYVSIYPTNNREYLHLRDLEPPTTCSSATKTSIPPVPKPTHPTHPHLARTLQFVW